jgi:hypothetical protein
MNYIAVKFAFKTIVGYFLLFDKSLLPETLVGFWLYCLSHMLIYRNTLTICLYLQEKLERLYELDRILQEQSFKVTAFQEDKVCHCSYINNC